MLCCEEGNSEMAELLLNSQADPNLQQLVSDDYSIIHLTGTILTLSNWANCFKNYNSNNYNNYACPLISL